MGILFEIFIWISWTDIILHNDLQDSDLPNLKFRFGNIQILNHYLSLKNRHSYRVIKRHLLIVMNDAFQGWDVKREHRFESNAPLLPLDPL